MADARTFAALGIDYLKYDNCDNENRLAAQRSTAMGDAIRASGRPMVYCTMSDDITRVATNQEVIAVNQDRGGRQRSKLRRRAAGGQYEADVRTGGAGRGAPEPRPAAVSIAVTTAELGLSGGPHVARDLWARRDAVVRGALRATVPGHGAAMYLVRR